MFRSFLFLIVLSSCGSNNHTIKNTLYEDLVDAGAFIYEIERDAEMPEDRAMQCFDPSTFKIPYWEVVDEGDAVYVDCPDSGVWILLPDKIKIQNNTDLNLSLIEGYRREE